MPISISGVGNMQADIKKARSIAKTWTQRGGSIQGAIRDQKLQIPSKIIENCHGICFLFYLKAGFLWSGGLGTGFVLTKINRGTPQQRWSAPSAITAGGLGWGLQIGAQQISHVIILNNSMAASTFMSKAKINMGGDLGVSAGPLGRNVSMRVEAGTGGVAATYSYSYAQGVFAGLCLDGTVLGANPEMNRRFYGRNIASSDLLKGRDGLDAWESCIELAELYALLDDALTNGGSMSTDHNYGNVPLSSKACVSDMSFSGASDWWNNEAGTTTTSSTAASTGNLPPEPPSYSSAHESNLQRAQTTSAMPSINGARKGFWDGGTGTNSENLYDSFAQNRGGVIVPFSQNSSRPPQHPQSQRDFSIPPPSNNPYNNNNNNNNNNNSLQHAQSARTFDDPHRPNYPAPGAGHPYESSRNTSHDLYGTSRDPYASARDPYPPPAPPPRDPYASSRDPYASSRDPYASSRDPYASSRRPPQRDYRELDDDYYR